MQLADQPRGKVFRAFQREESQRLDDHAHNITNDPVDGVSQPAYEEGIEKAPEDHEELEETASVGEIIAAVVAGIPKSSYAESSNQAESMTEPTLPNKVKANEIFNSLMVRVLSVQRIPFCIFIIN